MNLTLRGVIVSLSGLLETHDRLKNEREWLAIVVENEFQMKLTIDGSASRVMCKPTFQFEVRQRVLTPDAKETHHRLRP